MNELIKQTTDTIAAIGKKYPHSFSAFAKAALEEFDNTQVGTAKELKEKREAYEATLREKYKELNKQERKEKNRVMNDFKDKLFAESAVTDLPNGRKVFDKLYEMAYRDGHAYGLCNVVSEYGDKEDDFMELLGIMNGDE